MTAFVTPMTTLLAHSSHWLVQVAYVLPVVGLGAWLAVTAWRERRRGGDGDGDREGG